MSTHGNHRLRPKLPNTIRDPRLIEPLVRGNRDRCLERESARENSKTAQYKPLRGVKQPITPLQRGIQGPMTWLGGSTPHPGKIEAIVKQACGSAEAV